MPKCHTISNLIQLTPPKLYFRVIANVIGVLYLSLCVGQLEVYGQTRSTTDVRSALGDFFEEFLGRQLTQNELERVTPEFITYYGASTCQAECANSLDILKSNAALMKTKRGQPIDLLIRQSYQAGGVFNPKVPKGRLFERLLNEPDPVRVIDQKTKRLMTEKDIVALANLGIFLKAGGAPKPQSFSPQEINEAVKVLDRMMSSQSGSQRLPLLFSAAAEFWTGIQYNWSSLSANERQIVGDYIQYMSEKPMPVYLYSRIFGITEQEAQKIRNSERLDRLSSHIERTTSRYIDAMEQYNTIMNMQNFNENFNK